MLDFIVMQMSRVNRERGFSDLMRKTLDAHAYHTYHARVPRTCTKENREVGSRAYFLSITERRTSMTREQFLSRKGYVKIETFAKQNCSWLMNRLKRFNLEEAEKGGVLFVLVCDRLYSPAQLVIRSHYSIHLQRIEIIINYKNLNLSGNYMSRLCS